MRQFPGRYTVQSSGMRVSLMCAGASAAPLVRGSRSAQARYHAMTASLSLPTKGGQ